MLLYKSLDFFGDRFKIFVFLEFVCGLCSFSCVYVRSIVFCLVCKEFFCFNCFKFYWMKEWL